MISALGKLFLVLTEEWRWKPSQKLPLLQITEPLIQAVPRAQSRAVRYKGINSSSFWAIRIWAGAVPAREHPSPGSPCSDSFCVRILTRFSSFLLPPQRVFPEVFSGFVVFCLFCSAGFFALGLFCERNAPFPRVHNSLLAFGITTSGSDLSPWEAAPAEPHKSLTPLLICFFHGLLES